MCPDLNLQTLVINETSLDDLRWVFHGQTDLSPQPTELNDLAVEADWSQKRTVWVLYGASDPDTLAAVLSRITPCSKLIVLEAGGANDHHLDGPQREKLRQQVLDGRLSIILGGCLEQRANLVLQHINIDTMDGWKPLLSNKFIEQRPEEIKDLFSRLAAGLNTKVLHKNTLLAVTLPYLCNALVNAPLASQDARLAHWKGSRLDRPVLVVAAGPSLNKQMPLLAQHQDLFTILAVDTVWPILHKHGVVPDAILAIDRISRPSWPRNGVSDGTAFCVDIGCAPRLVWSNDHNHVLLSCNPDILALMQELGVKAEALRTGGSVATSAFQLAEEVGGNPIVFIGQDLALTGGKDHAEGYLHTYQPERLARISEAGYDVEGYYGDTVRTERQLLFYKNWFERRIKALPDKLVINATEGGACIAGAVQLPFAVVCQEIRATSLRKKPLMGLMRTRIDPEHMDQLILGLSNLMTRVQKFGELASQGRSVCRRCGARPSKKQLSRIDAINRELRDFEIHSKTMVDVMRMAQLDIIRYEAHIGQNMDAMSDVVRKYDEVYQTLQEGSRLALEMMEKVKVFYQVVQERGEIDPELAQSIFPI